MRVLGIDPGTASIGYALIDLSPEREELLEAGLIRTAPGETYRRLKELSAEISSLLKKWQPQVCAVERLFFTKNQKTAFAVAEARGAILLTTALAGITLYEYTPLEVKKTITGDGRADKTQVRKMLELTLPKVKDLTHQDDVCDAVAIALTCYFKERKGRTTV